MCAATLGVRLRTRARGFTLVELLVAVSIVGVMAALVLPAVQMAREAARKLHCANNLRQLALAAHSHHAAWGRLPPGISSWDRDPTADRLSWCARLLPYLEQLPLWSISRQEYARQIHPFVPIPHSPLMIPVATFSCPSEGRAESMQWARSRYIVALTDYVGVVGTDFLSQDGAMFLNSSVRVGDIRDGTSNTLLIGERPPSPDNWFGWWYAGYGQQGSGVPDMLLGVREQNIGYDQFSACTETLGEFQKGTLDNFCDALHFWSCHPGGAYFAFADGRVEFLSYESNDMLPALATRSQGD